MTIHIRDYGDTHTMYEVIFHGNFIETCRTSNPSIVDGWVQVMSSHFGFSSNHNRLIGLDIEWNPNTQRNAPRNPVATLQLCQGENCLVYQILHAPYIPQSLVDFLRSCNNTFVGAGIEADAQKLLEDYNLHVTNCTDLRMLAEHVLGEREMRNAGLKTLAARVMGVELEKPWYITRSCWDAEWLNLQQVQYACVDAFVSYEVGRRLFFWSGNTSNRF
ncbi:hypothetical protein HN51_005032 [Arachis hypogaea]|uniref:3'-5' exonuclease domain-containing protein n=2 Tax=Arachis TaxID=3817 RepID=A0A445DGD9_ARAHY|nr:3'-5' exonuclease-like [Arachis duranensis]XP_025692164.1 Werner Syndrome-like exonuclease [Arachis hypogaea]QHO38719.1 Werner Syndrome-like exonuclease [Arachis hypogaea]RYR62251.1 hypothetical protein Ahy_A04g019684 [Arachis hypogaea]